MKIPKKLKIGGHLFKIDCSQELEGKDGDCSTKMNLIRICKSIPQSQKEVTLFHELFHALNSSLGEPILGHALEESLSQQLYQIFKDNNLLK